MYVYVETVCNSAFRNLRFLIRSCANFVDVTALKLLFYRIVPAKLEYASVVCYPIYTYQQLELERVQKSFLEYISFKVTGVYPSH